MTFANPSYFFLLLALIPFVLWHFLLSKRRTPSIMMATTKNYLRQPKTLRAALVDLPFVLRLIAFVLVVVAMARPQTHTALSERETEGIDIMLALDVSTSMLTPDLRPDRITAAKQVAVEFVGNRPNDNIGLTLFAGEAFTQCPLTTDHSALLRMFQYVNCDLQQAGIIAPGTAIGMGVANAAAHLEKSKAKSKVIILLTDGENNAGEISPLMAADIARSMGIRVYTISVGTEGSSRQAVAMLPNGETYEADVEHRKDSTSLQQIAQATGGIFYRATSKNKLRDIYNDIDQLEKTKLRTINYDQHYEAFQPFVLAAILALLLELLLRATWLRRIP